MTAREVLDGIKAQLAADQSKTVHDAKFGDILRTGWCTYYFGADSKWHNARTGEIIADLEALEEERQADDEVSVWLTESPPSTVARLTAAVEGVLALADRLKSEAENAEHGARCAAEINDGAGLRAWEAEKYTFQQAERLIRAAIENALKESE